MTRLHYSNVLDTFINFLEQNKQAFFEKEEDDLKKELIEFIEILNELKNFLESTNTGFANYDKLSPLIIFVYLLGSFKIFDSTTLKNYAVNFKELLQTIILILAVLAFLGALIGFLDKKYTLRIDKFNIGGINVLFDKSSEIYIKTVGTYVSSKRSLFSLTKKGIIFMRF